MKQKKMKNLLELEQLNDDLLLIERSMFLELRSEIDKLWEAVERLQVQMDARK